MPGFERIVKSCHVSRGGSFSGAACLLVKHKEAVLYSENERAVL